MMRACRHLSPDMFVFPAGQIVRVVRVADKILPFAFELAVGGELFDRISQHGHSRGEIPSPCFGTFPSPSVPRATLKTNVCYFSPPSSVLSFSTKKGMASPLTSGL